jgi:Flp pilus assembly protein TadG
MRARATRVNDRGEATVQLVILTPILVLLVFLGVQAAIVYHATNVAAAAAAHGAAAASPVSANASNAIVEAGRTVSELGGDLAASPIAEDANGFVVVTVEVAVPRIVPFFPASVSRTAREPKERFVPESQR